ncbi:MAG: hypothetical protein AB1540_07400 [Bdellovibrionota bacterium]
MKHAFVSLMALLTVTLVSGCGGDDQTQSGTGDDGAGGPPAASSNAPLNSGGADPRASREVQALTDHYKRIELQRGGEYARLTSEDGACELAEKYIATIGSADLMASTSAHCDELITAGRDVKDCGLAVSEAKFLVDYLADLKGYCDEYPTAGKLMTLSRKGRRQLKRYKEDLASDIIDASRSHLESLGFFLPHRGVNDPKPGRPPRASL